jgi:hypothetical protein
LYSIPIFYLISTVDEAVNGDKHIKENIENGHTASPVAAATNEEATVTGDPIHSGTTSMAFPSIMHKDAFLIFRALCKLSMKGLHESDESGSLSDPIALQNK